MSKINQIIENRAALLDTLITADSSVEFGSMAMAAARSGDFTPHELSGAVKAAASKNSNVSSETLRDLADILSGIFKASHPSKRSF